MRFHFHIILSLLLIPACLVAQPFIKGKVFDEATGQPVAGASVYFNNTSIGAVSAADGTFSIPSTSLSNLQLIVSSVGYEILVYDLPKDFDPKRPIIFKLSPKQEMLEDILVLPDAVRVDYLKKFRDNFLGITQEAATSDLKNMGTLYFVQPPNDPGAFIARTDTPLIIINHMLGYKIYFELQEFYYNKNTGSSSFYGFTRYEESGDKKRWKKNREKAYYGSTVHFFRSLIHDDLLNQSFAIFDVRTDTLRLPDGTKKMTDMAVPLTAAQLLHKDSTRPGIFIVRWKYDKLMVQYNKDPASRSWLSQHTFLNSLLPRGFRSYLVKTTDYIEVDDNGILIDPLSTFYSGYWIYEKAANLLPYNYEPEKGN